jgi:galactarate dehydratase
VARIKAELLPKYPNVDDVVGLEHTYGCGVAIDATDAAIPIRTLRNISKNPNFGGEVMVVSLGCEKLQPERLLPPGTFAIRDDRGAGDDPALDLVRLQDEAHVGFASMVDSILASATRHLGRLNARRRETVPASALVVGVQCGGSDAFSGATANPAVGVCTDLLVRAGATVMFSETTEVRDGIDQLTARAASPELAAGDGARDGLVRRLPRAAAAPTAAPTPPREQGRGPLEHRREGDGLDRQVGSSPISGVLLARGAPARSRHRARPGLRGDAGERLHLRHPAAGGGHEPARLSPPAAARLTAWRRCRWSRSPPTASWRGAGTT